MKKTQYFCYLLVFQEKLIWLVTEKFHREESEPYYYYFTNIEDIDDYYSDFDTLEELLETHADSNEGDGEYGFITDGGGIRAIISQNSGHRALIYALFRWDVDL